jgi:outer membrane protein assembly factor BamB
MVTPTADSFHRPVSHRWWLPLSSLALIVAARHLAQCWQAAGWEPAALPHVSKIGDIATSFGLLVVIPLWWLLHSNFSWRRRLSVFGSVVLVLAAIFFFAIRRVELVTDERHHYPRFEFRWETSRDERLAAFRRDLPAAALPSIAVTATATDSPRFRGPFGDGSVRHLRLAHDWQQQPPRVLWRHPCGGGYSGFALAGNAAVTLEQREADEAVVCYDQQTGRERWVFRYPAHFQHFVGDGPRATPTIAGARVFSLGATGELVCLDARNGASQWRVNILTDNAAKNQQWGLAASPLVVDDTVIVQPGTDPANPAGRAVAAYRCDDGQRVWAQGGTHASYSSPQFATLGGTDFIIIFDAGGLAGLDPQTGREMWRHEWRNMMDTNTMQPLILGPDRIFISSESDRGCALIGLSAPAGAGGTWTTHTIWQSRLFSSRYSCPVATPSGIFGLSNGILTCLDPATGERRWKEGRFGPGQLLLVGSDLLIQSDQGGLVLVAADPNTYREFARLHALNGKTWNMPAIAGRRLFVRNQSEVSCLELPVTE